jgi:predicted enzyme related to lactoylglutathione lyase
MSLYRVILPVTDIETGSRFYADILGEPGRRVSPGRHYFGDRQGGAVLALYSPVHDGDAGQYGVAWRQHPLQYLYFSVDDLEAARGRCVAAGAGEITDIAAMPWGETMFYALDPSETRSLSSRRAPNSQGWNRGGAAWVRRGFRSRSRRSLQTG